MTSPNSSVLSPYPETAVIMAPLAGYTDRPFRRSMRRHGCQFAFTEMVDAESLTHSTRKSLYYIDPDPIGAWLGVQLVSNVPDALKQAVGQLSAEHFALIDFNLGCPAPKVAKKGEGARLARENPELALKCVDTIVANSKLPVTAKMRILSETDPEATLQFAQRLEHSGITALTIHGRIMERFYSGPVFHNIIRLVRENVNIPVIANGGIMGVADDDLIRAESGCSRRMIARGALGNPWIFEQLEKREQYQPPTVSEYVEEIRLYLSDVVDYYGETLGLKIARKTVLEFLKGRGYGGELKNSIAKLSTQQDVENLLKRLAQGPDAGYWTWLAHMPDSPRRLHQ